MRGIERFSPVRRTRGRTVEESQSNYGHPACCASSSLPRNLQSGEGQNDIVSRLALVNDLFDATPASLPILNLDFAFEQPTFLFIAPPAR